MRTRALTPSVLALLVLAAPAADAAPKKKAKAPAGPALAKLAPAPKTLTGGEQLAYAITAKATKSAATKKTKVALSLSKDTKASKDDLVLGSAGIKALKKGRKQALVVRVAVPRTAKPGTYRLLACVGRTCKVARGKVTVKAAKAPSKPGPGTTAAGGVGGASFTAPSEQSAPPVPPSSAPGTGSPSDPAGPGPGKPTDPGPGKPVDPPKPDPGAATSIADRAKAIYEGEDAPQEGVQPGAIKSERVAVARGTVRDARGQAIPGVEVTVLDHPEYGRTHTREDGGFDFALNGATVDLVFRKAGYPDVQRQVSAAWRDYDVVDDVLMTAYDQKVSTVDLDANAAFQAVVGTAQPGEPAPVLLFPKDLKATLDLAGKRTAAVTDDLQVRATEFPRTGDQTLPGTMPGNVGLTYAAEFSVDEAIKQGASSVDFDKPVINYTTNRIGAPVGSPVPTAYYDREAGKWIPQPNGIVLGIVSELDGAATVDVTGDGAADTGAPLAKLGITEAELRELARLYEPGRSLWRVPVRHFTPWDHNWPWGPPPDAKPPKLKEFEWKDPNDPCTQQGSIISCENQVLAEQVPVAGTPYTLTWSSQRAPGYKVSEQLTLPVTGGAVPDRLKGVQLEVEIAGKKFEQRWCDPNYPTTGQSTCEGLPPIKPNLTYDVAWDGKDAYGDPVQGKPVATVTVTYVYEFNYYPSSDDFERSFGQFPEGTTTMNGAPYCGNQLPSGYSNEQIKRSHFLCGILSRQTVKRSLGSWDAGPVDGLGGVSLDVHHGYDPNERVVHRGDGTVLRSETLGMQTRTIVGGGRNVGPEPTPSRDTNIDYLNDSTVLADGRVCGYSGMNQSFIWCQQPDGTVKAIAGKDQPNAFGAIDPSPVPALGAVLGKEITGIAAGPDGSIYFSAYAGPSWEGYIRRVRPDGVLETIAGYQWSTESPRTPGNGDGGPATRAKIHYRGPIAVGPDGSVVFAEPGGGTNGNTAVVRRISPDGTISRIAGGGSDATATEDLGDGEPATQHRLDRIDDLAIDDDGTIYLADSLGGVVQKIGPDGRIQRVVGTGNYNQLETGERGADNAIGFPKAVAIAPDGSLYVRTTYDDDGGSDQKIMKVDETGLTTRVAGRTSQPLCRYCSSQDGESASGTLIESNSNGLDVLGDGTVVYSDGRYQVRRLEPALPGFADGAAVVPESDGSSVHLFDAKGRHLRTVDGMNGATKVAFEYDGENRMTAVIDGAGNTTKIERDGSGKATAIVAPHGQRTTLTMDGAGRLERVDAPGDRTWKLTYGAGSLLSDFEAPGAVTSHFEYDADGRLLSDRGPDGSVQRLQRTESLERTVVEHTSGAGKVTQYVVEVEDDGDRVRRVTTPDGDVTKVELKPDGTQVTTAPDGTTTTTESDPDPRWGTQVAVPSKRTVVTPKGKTEVIETKRTVTLKDPLNKLSVLKQTETITRENDPATSGDDQVDTVVYDGEQRTLTRTSEGRRVTQSTFDELGRVVRFDGDGPSRNDVDPVVYAYGDGGRLASMVQGNRRTTYTYDERGRMKTQTDAAGDTLTFGYDDADRVVSETYPGSRVWRYEHQADGALKALVSPEGRRHAFSSNARGRERSYDPPGAAGAYVRSYDADGRLEALRLPGGKVRDVGYDARGRETTTDHGGEASDTLAYPAAGSDPTSMTRTTGGVTQSLTQVLDGGLPEKTTFAGKADGSVDYTIGEKDQRLEQLVVKSGDDTATIAFGYDDDGFVNKIGPFTLTREGAGGAVTEVEDGTMTTTLARDRDAGLARRTVKVGDTVVYENAVTRDTQGRIDTRVRKVGATATSFAYDYSEVGELTSVKVGDDVLESHAYDKDGNRRSYGAAYDDEGRLTALGGKPVTTDADGFVTKVGDDTFTYTRAGDLTKAVVGGKTVEYAYDAMGRRVARTEDGVTEQYLYGNPVNPFQLTASRGRDGVLTTWFYDAEDALVAFERGGKRFYVGADQVGTPEAVFDAEGKLLRSIERDAFGIVRKDSAPTHPEAAVPLAVGYAGGLADPVTGLVRFGARDYDPRTGRFLARDPSLFEGSPKNLYAYVGSDPVSMTDPTGLACFGANLLMGAGIGLQYCRKDGKQSMCMEAGVGVGGGIEVDPWGDAASSGPTSVIGEVTGKWGPVGASLGFETDLDCFNTKGGLKVSTAVGVSAGIDTTGSTSWTYGGDDANSVNGKGIRNDKGGYGGKVEGKLVLKRCIGY